MPSFCRLLLLLCLSLLEFPVSGCKGSHAQLESAVDSAVPRASVVVASRAPLFTTLTVAGELLPYQEVELHAKVAGFIHKIHVDIGDRVRTGQVLAVLEIPELTAQVQGADAGVRHSQEEVSLAKSEVARAIASHAALHSASERLKQAAAARPGMIAQQELDDAEAKDIASEAQVAAAKSAVLASEQQLDASRANRTHYSSLADYSRIVAPFDGIVTWRYADTGALIQAGTSNAGSMPVVKVAQVNMLRLRIPVPESLSVYVRDGDTAEIYIQATNERRSGKVIRTTGSLDRSTRTLQVEVDLPNADMKLAPGMYADVKLRIQANPNALGVPVQAVNHGSAGTSVLVVNANDRVERRMVKTGIEGADRVEITEGLRDGEKVIVGNLASYQAGQKVAPRQSSMTAANDAGGEN